MELHHLGLASDQVPADVLLVTAGLLPQVDDLLDPVTVVRRREYTSGRLRSAPEVLMCSGPLGAPATVIALEELRRAGARSVVLITSCRCRRCVESDGPHELLVPRGAVRNEGTSRTYAPLEFPAVPDHGLLLGLVDALGVRSGDIVHTVDVPPEWAPDAPSEAETGEPIDLETAAVLVAAAAGGLIAAAVVVGSAVRRSARSDVVRTAARTLHAVTAPA